MSTNHQDLLADVMADFEKLVQSLRAGARVRVLEDEVQEAVYGVAYGALSGRHFDRAAALFAFLAAQRPTEARFLAGLGLSRAGQEEHLQAVLALSLASHFEPENPHHLLSLTQSLLALGEADMAHHALKALELIANDSPEHEQLLQHARSLARMIKNARTTDTPASVG
jgi:predicted Zn-dependent protease